MERTGTELAGLDRGSTGRWNGLALNWQGQIVVALDDVTGVNPSRENRIKACRQSDAYYKRTFGDNANAPRRSIKERVCENVNINHMVQCREGSMVFRLGLLHILKYNHTSDEAVQTLTPAQKVLELGRGNTEAPEALYKISAKQYLTPLYLNYSRTRL
jgi:hypothetical protein